MTPELERVRVVRQREFQFYRNDLAVQFGVLLERFRTEKFTGKLIVNLSQGSVNSIQAEDSQRLPSHV